MDTIQVGMTLEVQDEAAKKSVAAFSSEFETAAGAAGARASARVQEALDGVGKAAREVSGECARAGEAAQQAVTSSGSRMEIATRQHVSQTRLLLLGMLSGNGVPGVMNALRMMTVDFVEDGKVKWGEYRTTLLAAFAVSGVKASLNTISLAVNTVIASARALYGTTAGQLTAASEAAKGYEAVLRDVDSALRLTGQYSREYMGSLVEVSGELQNLTGVSDDAVLAAAALGVQFGVQRKQMDGALRMAAGFAKVARVDMASAMEVVSNVLAGNTAMLARHVPAVRNAANAEEAQAAALEYLSQAYGVAQGAMNTLAGEQTRYENAVDDLRKELGILYNTGLRPVYGALADLAESNGARAMMQELGKFAGLIALEMGTAAQKVIAVWDALSELRSANREGFELIKSDAIDAAFDYVKAQVQIVFEYVGVYWKQYMTPLVGALRDMLLEAIASVLEEVPLMGGAAEGLRGKTYKQRAEDEVRGEFVEAYQPQLPAMIAGTEEGRAIATQQFDKQLQNDPRLAEVIQGRAAEMARGGVADARAELKRIADEQAAVQEEYFGEEGRLAKAFKEAGAEETLKGMHARFKSIDTEAETARAKLIQGYKDAGEAGIELLGEGVGVAMNGIKAGAEVVADVAGEASAAIESKMSDVIKGIESKYDKMIGTLRGPESKAGQRYRERNEEDAARYAEKATEYKIKAMKAREGGNEDKAAEYEREAERYGGYAEQAQRRADPRTAYLRDQEAKEQTKAQAAMALDVGNGAAGGGKGGSAGSGGKGEQASTIKTEKTVESAAKATADSMKSLGKAVVDGFKEIKKQIESVQKLVEAAT